MPGQQVFDKKYYAFKEYLQLNKIPEWYSQYFNYEDLLNKAEDAGKLGQEKLKGYFAFLENGQIEPISADGVMNKQPSLYINSDRPQLSPENEGDLQWIHDIFKEIHDDPEVELTKELKDELEDYISRYGVDKRKITHRNLNPGLKKKKTLYKSKNENIDKQDTD